MIDAGHARRTAAALAFTLLVWGSAFVGLRQCLRTFSPGHLVLLRFAAASLTYLFIAPPTRIRPPARRDWPMVVLVGLLSTVVYHVLLNLALVTVTAGSASMVTNTAPVWATILAAVFLKERVDLRSWIGLVASLTGVALISLGEGHSLHLAPGIWLLVGAAAAWGLNIVLQKPLMSRCSPLQVSAYSVWVGSLGLLVFLPGIGDAVRHAPAASLLWVAYLGAVPVALAYVTWAYVLAHLPAADASRWLFLIPVIATALGWPVLGEMPSPLALLGGALAIGGVAFGATGRSGAREPEPVG